MQYLLGSVIVLFLVLLVAGAIRGSISVRSCCTIADPRRDARMRDAFADGGDAHGPGLRKPSGTSARRFEKAVRIDRSIGGRFSPPGEDVRAQ